MFGRKDSFSIVNIEKLLKNDFSLLPGITSEVLKEVEKKGVSSDILFDVNLAMQESLQNAMQHGNKMDPTKKVKFKAQITDNFFELSVEDEGVGFDPETLPDPTKDENLLKENGRGVYLLTHLMDEVCYENSGRRVIMKKFFTETKGKRTGERCA